MKCHIPADNTPARIEIPKEQSIQIAANESKPHLKRGRPVGTKDKIPQKRKIQENQVAAPKESIPMRQATKGIDLSEILEQKSHENEHSKKDPLKEESPEGLSFKEN